MSANMNTEMPMGENIDTHRSHCLSKPGATEDHPWGDVAFKVKGKMFACTGPEGNAVTVKSTLEQQAVLIEHPHITTAAYVGRYGWVTVELATDETLELALELIDESYEMIARGNRKTH